MGSNRLSARRRRLGVASVDSDGCAVAQPPDSGNPAPARRQAQSCRAGAADRGRQAGSVRRLGRRRPPLPLQHRPGSEARGHSALGRGAVPAARAGFPKGQSPREMPPGQRPVSQFLQPDQDRPDSRADRDAVRVSQQPASNRVHRWSRSSQGSQPHLAGLLGRAMGGGHAGRDQRGVQRPGLARQRRTSTDRIAPPHGTPPASRLRSHGFRNDDRRSESIYQAVHHQDGAEYWRRTPICWRTSARTNAIGAGCPATPASD